MSEAAASQGRAPGRGLTRVLSDDRLTKRAIGGDERAFAGIFRRYHQSLYRFCLAIVGNPEDAQDALQNTMAKVLRALPGEERRIELKPWLYRIAHNESIDLLRRRRETRELDAELAAPGIGLAEDVATRERLRQLIADMGELPERQREVLVMRELAGLGFEEIGSALGTSGAVARQALYEARQSLRQMEEGREMSCEVVTRALSDGDGRVIRRRDVRAHLRTCASCRHFGDDIKRRRRDLAAISPLPAAAAAGLMHGLLGGGQAGGGGGLAALAGSAAKGVGASTALKGAATVAVVAAIGAGAADRSGVIHLGLPGDRGSAPATGSQAGGAPDSSAGEAAEGSGGASGAATVGSHSKAAGAATPNASPAASGHGSTGVAAGRSQAANGFESSPSAPSENGQGHPRGSGHEKQQPAAAHHGQQTAATNHGGAGGQGASHGAGGAEPLHPAHPAAAPPAAHPEHPAAPIPKPAPAAGGAGSEGDGATEPEAATAPEALAEGEAGGSEEFGGEVP